MYDNGFIKIFRKLRKWGWYSDPATKDVFLHLLLIANWEGREFLGHKLKPGDCVIGQERLAEELGLSRQQVRAALKKLERTGEITLFPTNKFTIVTVENWRFYQGEEDDANQQKTINQPSTNHQSTTTKEYKEYKESKNTPPKPPSRGARASDLVDDVPF